LPTEKLTPSTACTVPTRPAQNAAAHRVMLDEVGDLKKGTFESVMARPPISAARQHAAK
jgi:hypothetical protein